MTRVQAQERNLPKSEKMRLTDKRFLGAFISAWLFMQAILVFHENPVIFISDEMTYKMIAYDLFHFRVVSSTHYPILYPLLISAGLISRNHFLEWMLAINILSKAAALILIYRLMPETEWGGRRLSLIMIGFSPIFFSYSRLLMAENLAFPLLVINILYHAGYRERRWNGKMGEVWSGFLAAVLTLALYWTKYLMIVMIPVFCLYWCIPALKAGDEKIRGFRKFAERFILYVVVVCAFIFFYGLYYSVRAGMPLFESIKSTMGLGLVEEGVYQNLSPTVSLKWLDTYILYVFLTAMPVIALVISEFRWESVKQNRALWTMVCISSVMMVFMSTRHSSNVNYNAGGKMISVLGRYIAYITPMIILLWSKEHRDNIRVRGGFVCSRRKRLLRMSILDVLVLVSYELVYVHSQGIADTHGDWLGSIATADTFGFKVIGLWCCILYFIVIAVVLFGRNNLVKTLSICALFCLHSYLCMFTLKDYHHAGQYAYSESVRDFIEQCKASGKKSKVLFEKINFTSFSMTLSLYDNNGSVLDYVGMEVLPYDNGYQELDPETDYYFYLEPKEVDEKTYDEQGSIYYRALKDRFWLLRFLPEEFEGRRREYTLDDNGNGTSTIRWNSSQMLFVVQNNAYAPIAVSGDNYSSIINNSSETDIYDLLGLTNCTLKAEDK